MIILESGIFSDLAVLNADAAEENIGIDINDDNDVDVDGMRVSVEMGFGGDDGDLGIRMPRVVY